MRCVICGKEFYGSGHNPEPLLTYDRRVCEVCNAKYIIPVRIMFCKEGGPDREGIHNWVADSLPQLKGESLL